MVHNKKGHNSAYQYSVLLREQLDQGNEGESILIVTII